MERSLSKSSVFSSPIRHGFLLSDRCCTSNPSTSTKYSFSRLLTLCRCDTHTRRTLVYQWLSPDWSEDWGSLRLDDMINPGVIFFFFSFLFSLSLFLGTRSSCAERARQYNTRKGVGAASNTTRLCTCMMPLTCHHQGYLYRLAASCSGIGWRR